MQDAMRIGAAALGGYVLGRTKKAKAALTLGLFLAGKGRPSDVARNQAMKALQSDKGQELLAQLRGPVAGAGRQAALSLFESQAGRLSDSLGRRTDQLGAPAKGKRGRQSDDEGYDDEYDDDEGYEDEYEDEDEDEEYDDEESDDEQSDEDYEDEYEADDEDEDEESDDYEDEQSDDDYEDEYESRRPARRAS